MFFVCGADANYPPCVGHDEAIGTEVDVVACVCGHIDHRGDSPHRLSLVH